MRLRNVPGSRDDIANSEYVIHEPEKHKGEVSLSFPVKQPLFIEIGMGKGRYISSLSKKYYNNSTYSKTYVIGIDMIEAMLGLAKREIENSILDISKEERETIIKKRDGDYTNKELKEKIEGINKIENFKNIRILNANAEKISDYFRRRR